MKWFRKHKATIMITMIAILFVGFVLGSWVQSLSERKYGKTKTVATYGSDKKITLEELTSARAELELLQMLGADTMLRGSIDPLTQTPDLTSILLGELLFSNRQFSPEIVMGLKQVISRNEYRITDKQINDIYDLKATSNVYWFLLKNEARQAGIRIPTESAKQQLAQLLSQLAGGDAYTQVMTAVVNRQGLPEATILQVYADLLAVNEYTKLICSSDAVTQNQIKHTIASRGESADLQFVRIDAASFAEFQPTPSEEELTQHFEAYKNLPSDVITEDNPYGFGYQLPPRVKLEYLAVDMEQVRSTIQQPTMEEAEDYYQSNQDVFTEEKKADPNDPNSATIKEIQSFVEVRGSIIDRLIIRKTNAKAEKVLQSAIQQSQTGFENVDKDLRSLTSEEYRQLIGDYGLIAEQLNKQQDVTVFYGVTGMLSARDFAEDQNLATLYITGYGYDSQVSLGKLVFAVDEVATSELGPFEADTPRMYENIGIIKDRLAKKSIVARVIEAQKESVPQNFEGIVPKSSITLGQDPNNLKFYSVKREVEKDIKTLSAMKTANELAEKMTQTAQQQDWDKAIQEANNFYKTEIAKDPNAADIFKITEEKEKSRISSIRMQNLAARVEGNPEGLTYLRQGEKQKLLMDTILSLVEADANDLKNPPVYFEFKPEMACYVMKQVAVKRVSKQQFEQIKNQMVFQENMIRAQSMAPVHYNPENILKRNQFKWAETEETILTEPEQSEPQPEQTTETAQ